MDHVNHRSNCAALSSRILNHIHQGSSPLHGDDLARDCSIKHFGYTSIITPIVRRNLRIPCAQSNPEKADKQGMPLTSLSPIPSLNPTFFNGMGLRLVNGIPCLSAFSGVDRDGHH